ncbi:MAG: hypothetical protein ACYC3X_17155 [Pirellulaceae bacterium]
MMGNVNEARRDFIGLVIAIFLFTAGHSEAAAADPPGKTIPGQLQSVSWGALRDGFLQPDMIYAPFCFWFWDEPLDASKYPDKARAMAREMLRQGLNPGYVHPRVSMADLTGPKAMAPSPSLPKEQWLSEAWFESFAAASQEAEAAHGYLGYVDEYMSPGRAVSCMRWESCPRAPRITDGTIR